MGKAINVAGHLIDTAAVSDADRAAAKSRADARKILRDAQQQAQTEQASLEQQAVQYFIRGEAFPAELKDYHAALGDVLTASVGDALALPVQPAILSAPKVR